MSSTTSNWLLRLDKPAPTPRVPRAVQYHRVYAGEKRRILRGILAIVLLVVGLVVFARLRALGAAAIDAQLLGRTGATPLTGTLVWLIVGV